MYIFVCVFSGEGDEIQLEILIGILTSLGTVIIAILSTAMWCYRRRSQPRAAILDETALSNLALGSPVGRVTVPTEKQMDNIPPTVLASVTRGGRRMKRLQHTTPAWTRGQRLRSAKQVTTSDE